MNKRITYLAMALMLRMLFEILYCVAKVPPTRKLQSQVEGLINECEALSDGWTQK